MPAIAGKDCIGEGTLSHFAQGRLDAERAGYVRAHLDSCGDCQALLDLVSADARYAQTELKNIGTVVAHGGIAATPVPLARTGPPARTQRASSSHDGVVRRPIPGDGTGPTSIGVQVGDIIDNKYLVERILGAGGMGLVLQATHLQLRQPVALKFMHAEAMQNPEAAARFNREARAAVKLTGQHVCRVLDMGTSETDEPYIVFEYLDGQDLGDMLADRGTLPTIEAVSYILQACDAMAEAHSHGIVHRDLKPGNLFVTRGRDGALLLKVLDFGISKYVGAETDAVKTTTRSLMGSPLYMAPEQLLSAKDVDARADIWALGAVLYQLLSGKTPFHGETLPTVIAQVMHATAAPLADIVEGVEPGLCDIVDRCLSRDRSDRYEDVADLAAALVEFAPGAAFMAERTAAVLAGARPSQAVAVPSQKRRPLGLIAAAAGVLIAAGIALAVGLSGDSKTDTAKPAAATAVEPEASSTEQEPPAPNPQPVVEPTDPEPTAAGTEELSDTIEMPEDAVGSEARKRDRRADRRDKSAGKKRSSRAKSRAEARAKASKPPPLMEPTDTPKPKKPKKPKKPVGDGMMDPD